MYIHSLLNCSLLHILFIRTHWNYLGTLLPVDPGKLQVSVHGRLPVLLHTTRYQVLQDSKHASASKSKSQIHLDRSESNDHKKPKANNRIFSPALEMAKFALAAIVLLTAGKQAICVVLLSLERSVSSLFPNFVVGFYTSFILFNL